MNEADLLEIIATGVVLDIARELRMQEQAANPGRRAPPLDTYFEEAARLMRRRRAAIIPALKD